MEHEVTWKKRQRECDLLPAVGKPIVPIFQAPFSLALFWRLHAIIYLYFNVQVWTLEKILSSYNRNAMILILLARVALDQV